MKLSEMGQKISVGIGASTKKKLIYSATAFALIIASSAFLIDESPEAQRARLIRANDSEKLQEIGKAMDAESEASALQVRASNLQREAETMMEMAAIAREESNRASRWALDCRAANSTGSVDPSVDCDTIQSSMSGETIDIEEIISEMGEKSHEIPAGTGSFRPFLLMYGHGLHENGRWQDNGAVLDDGTNERALVMGIADTVKNHAKPDSVIGRERHTLKDNLAFAQKEAVRLGCVNGKRCFLLSIHANMSEDASKRGAVAYFNPYDGESKRFATDISACFGGKAVSDERNRWGRLAAVRDVEGVSAVLFETGYMSNGKDLAFLKDGAGSKLAKCVSSVAR